MSGKFATHARHADWRLTQAMPGKTLFGAGIPGVSLRLSTGFPT